MGFLAKLYLNMGGRASPFSKKYAWMICYPLPLPLLLLWVRLTLRLLINIIAVRCFVCRSCRVLLGERHVVWSYVISDTHNVTVLCGVSYRVLYQWILRVQCLPNVLGQTELTPDGITYTKSFNATPDINGIVINCIVKFNSTGYRRLWHDVDNVPDDVQLWKSAPLHVQCKQCLSAEIFCELADVDSKLTLSTATAR